MFFDIDDPAAGPLCAMCISEPERAGHRVLQVRRSTYHEVLKVSDIGKLLNLDGECACRGLLGQSD